DNARGEQVFGEAGCAICHSGPAFTDGLRHDVGTALGSGETRGPMIDTPTLLGLYDTAPYLHDGSASTPRDVFSIASDSSPHALVDDLSGTELDDLIAYLLSLPQT
ncbi:MAG TPA: c-type cytochrome, partial [Acidimicrobiales bacterium]|nr:c-type cytochrome [Acidimicrobiales bacterium]